MKNTDLFEIVCGNCGEKMYVESEELKCKNCSMIVSGKYLENFFDEKYRDKITKIEVTNKNSAKIYFAK